LVKDQIKTFTYKSIKISVYPDVYEPAEDTFILLENIRVKKNDNVLELGTGCGIIAIECAKSAKKVLATDISPKSIICAKENYKKNKHKLKSSVIFRQGSLFSIIKNNEKFEIIIFNPPYLPTTKKEYINGWLNYAFDGGEDGLHTICQFLKNVKNYLTKNGKAYFIFSSLSNQKKLHRNIKENDLKYDIIKNYSFNNDWIDLYRISLE
jgi:release factor glutamine methyltransferase